MTAGLVLSGRFRLIEELGRGAMGTVWRAEDLELEAPAAVKLIDAQYVQAPEALARFRREAKAAAAIRSTHVVQILEYGVENGAPYIAMELLRGETLAKRLEQVGVLSPSMTFKILTHVGRALSLAHENGIVHRDLKPDNIFLVREMDEDVGKVLDFGIARKLGSLGETGGFRTQSGALLGTPYYMSPEHIMGQSVDHRSDIWSFGVIAFQCLTGKLPFEHESLGGLFHAICVVPPPVPSEVGAVPQGFDAWFALATARDPNQRFQTVNEAVSELRPICRNASIPVAASAERRQETGTPNLAFDQTAPPVPGTTSASSPPSKKLAWQVGAAIAVLMILGAVLYARHGKGTASMPGVSASFSGSTPAAADPPRDANSTKVAPATALTIESGQSPVMPFASGLANAVAASATPTAIAAKSEPKKAALTRTAPSHRTAQPVSSGPKKAANVAGF